MTLTMAHSKQDKKVEECNDGQRKLIDNPIYRAKRMTKICMNKKGARVRKLLSTNRRLSISEVEQALAPNIADTLSEPFRRVIASRHIVAIEVIAKAFEERRGRERQFTCFQIART